MKHYVPIFLLALTTMASQCEDAQVCAEGCDTKVKVVNLTGLDGCGLMLEDEKGIRYEVTEKPADMELYEDAIYCIGYKEANAASVCMAGKTIEVTCFKNITPKE